ncbi:MAG: hypothetical protein R3E53_08695 [Myxococcota bacterium]
MHHAVDVVALQLATLDERLGQLDRAPDRIEQTLRLFAVGGVELFDGSAEAEQLRDPRQLLAPASRRARPSTPGQLDLEIGARETPATQRQSFGGDARVGEDAMGIDELLRARRRLLAPAASRRRTTVDGEG